MVNYEDILNKFSKEEREELRRLGVYLQKEAPYVGYIIVDDSKIVSIEVPGSVVSQEAMKIVSNWNQQSNEITLDVYPEYQNVKGERYFVKDLLI